MNKTIIKLSMYWIILLVTLSLASAANMTIQELIDSYDYGFNNGTINVTSQDDYMIDQDADGTNDTLIINITTDAVTTGTYNFIVEIIDENGILINDTSKSITASDASANVNFPSELLSNEKFNYSIRINDNDDNLIFRKFNVESQTYLNYETGTNVTLITDENINNNFVRINLTIDSSQAITTNITVTLAFNSSTISKTEETTLSSGVQVVSIDFDNETIKSTHYNSNFTIDTVVVGNKIFDFDQNTSIYNYEDFAKTSYIKSIADGRIDSNNNNLSEFLEINFTVEVKTADSYTISYDLYDQFDNFVINISKNETLAVGTQNVQTLINGSQIYKTKINGPYVLSFAKLHIGNDTKDIIFDAHTTNQSFYTDYERPPLPDLKVTINVSFDSTTNATNITLNLSNIGEAQAFNVFLDIFDNVTYENNRSLAFVDVNEHIIYEFNITNSLNTILVTAIADFDNLVDESNESNNIVQNVVEGAQAGDTTPPFINITSPTNNTVYQTTSVDLNWTSNETLDWCAYSLDGEGNISSICFFNDKNNFSEFNYQNISSTITGNINIIDINEWLNKSISKSPSGTDMTVDIEVVFNLTLNLTLWKLGNDLEIAFSFFSVNTDSKNWDNGTINISILNHTSSKYITKNESNIFTDNYCFVSSFKIPYSTDLNNSFNLTTFRLNYVAYDNNLTNGQVNSGDCDGVSLTTVQAHFVRARLNYTTLLRNITLNSLSSGKHNITIYGNDSSGNMGQSDYVYFTVNASLSPTINSISATPSQQGFGKNITITANITDADGKNDIDTVLVGIIPPSETETNYTMNNIGGDLWQYKFTDFTNGTYSYTVYVNDSAGLTDSSSGTFEMFVNFRTQIHTLNDTYSENEFVKLTDPPNLISRTESSDTYQNGDGSYTTIFYSGVRNVFENEKWKRVEEARSLKNKGFNVIYLEKDPELILDVIDFNYSSITYIAKVKGSKIGKPIPIKIYRQNHTFNEIKWKAKNPGKKVTWKVKSIKQSEQIHKFNRIGNQTEELRETISFGLDYYLEFGENSTTIILQDADTENLDDTWTEELGNPNLNHGGDDTLYLDDTRHWRPYLKFDILQIPSGAVINEAYLYGYGKHENGPNTPVNIYHVYNHTWKEDVIVHSTQPCGANFDDSSNCNLTAEDTVTFAGENQWNIFNITNAVKTEYADNDNNVSMALKSDDGFSFGQQSIKSKENSNITARVYLNVTSSGGKTTPEENQSKIVNNGPTNASVYLLMKVQFYDSGTWLDEAIIINDTEKRTITNGETLALDTIWNPNAWNTSTSIHGSGTYRVYVAATDENNNVLKNKNGTDIEATYNFTLSIPDTIPPSINILSPINNTVYQETSIDLNWTSNEELDWCAYSLDGGANNTEICKQSQGLDGWNCRNEITLQNNFSVDMVSASIRINVMKDLPDFNAADFNDDGSDIRFTDNQSNNLSSFVEVWNETNEQTIVWVNTTIPANSNTTVNLYHCNENANAYNNYDFMNSFENFTSGKTPNGWNLNALGIEGGFNDTTTINGLNYSAFYVSDNDNNNFNPVLPPPTNYTVDFYYYVNSSQIVDNGYWHDGGGALLRWESSVPNNQPEAQFSCKNSSGDTLAVSEALTDRWIRMVIIRQRAPESSSDKSLNHTRIRVYDNETFYNICNGTVAGFGTSQSRLQWSFSGGNGGANKLRIENFKMYKNFGWNTSDLTLYSDNKISTVTQQNITLTDLSEGSHNITIYGNDSSGNMGQSDYIYFTVDTKLPPFFPTSSINNSNPKINEVVGFGQNVTDVSDTVSMVIFSHNQSGLMVNVSNTSIINSKSINYTPNLTITLSRGNVIGYGFWANDTLGEVNTTQIKILTVANTPPPTVTEFIFPSESPAYGNSNITIQFGAVTDADNDTVLYRLYMNATCAICINSSENLSQMHLQGDFDSETAISTVIASGDNVYGFLISTYDQIDYGINSSTRIFILDTTLPNLTILNPVNNTVYDSTSIDLNWTSNEELDWCAYSLDDDANNTDICPSGIPTNITLTNLSEGSHNITIYGNDSSGNMGQSDYIYFTVETADTIPPVISNLKNTTTTNESVIFTWDTDEAANESNTLGICPAFTGVFSNDNSTFGTSHIQSIGSLKNSTNYCFNTTACDSSGNCASDNFSFTTAANPPIPDITPPTFSNFQNNASTVTQINGQVNWSIDFQDNEGLDTTLLATNSSGTFENETTESLNGVTSIHVAHTRNVTIAAGNYICGQFWVNDTSGNVNQTGLSCFTVAIITGEVNLLLNGTDGDLSLIDNQTINATGILVSGEGTIRLERNGTVLKTGESPIQNISNYTFPSYYNFTIIYDGNENFTAARETHFLELNESADTNPPTFSLFQFNNSAPKVNEDVNISIQIDDNKQLDWYTFAQNATGQFVNDSLTDISGLHYDASTIKTTPLTRGHKWCGRYWANDTSGNSAETSGENCVTIANTPPGTPTILFPTNDLYTKQQPLDLNVTFAEDADSDSITIYYYINSILNQTSATNTTFNASDGYYILNVSLFDGTDFSGNTTVNFTIDTTLPIVNGTLNKSINDIVENDVINATFDTTDETQLSYGQIIINDTGFKRYFNYSLIGTQTQFSQNFTVSCSSGCVVNITGRVNDTSNNKKQNETIFTVADVTLPIVNTSLNKSLTNIVFGDVINLTANITDEVGLSFCQIIINQSGPDNLEIINISLNGATSAQCSNSSPVILSAGGVINYTIRVNDTSNNFRTNDTIITVASPADTTPPIVNATLNKSLTTIRINDIINVSANATDVGGELAFGFIGHNMSGTLINYTFTLSGTEAEFSQNITVNLTRGNVINFSVIVNDSANPANTALNDTIFTVINSPPEAPTILLPSNDEKLNSIPIELNVTFPEDADKDTITINYYINGKLNDSTTTNTTFNASDGVFILNVSLFDGEDSSANVTVNFTLDTTLPIVNATLNKSSSNIRINDIINVSANATDETGLSFGQILVNISGFLRIFNFSLNDATTAEFSQNITINVSRGEVINFTARVNDTSNNFKTNDTIIMVANTLPSTATIVFPTDLLNTTQQPLDLNVTFAEDADNDIITIYYYINGKLNQTSTVNTTFNASDGNYILNVSLYDGVDFSANVTREFTLDTTNPTVTLEYPGSNYANDTSDPYSLLFNCSVTDNLALKNISLYITNSLNQSFSLNRTANISGTSNVTNWTVSLANGNYTWNCLSYDHTGNLDWGNSNRSILINFTVVDTTVPVVNTSLNKSNNIAFGAVINLTANATDETELSFGQVIVNDTGSKRYFNFSLESLTEAEFSQNITIACFGGCVINFTARSNDTSNNFRTNDTIITVIDDIKSRINSSINNSAPKINEIVNMTANVTDEVALSFCQFFMNGTSDGSFIILNKSVSGTDDQCSQNFTIDLIRGNVINFTVVVNDTSNNVNQSEQLVTVVNTPPAGLSIVFPTNNLYTNLQPLDLNVTFTEDPDNDVINISYYINGILNQTSLTNTTFNASDGYYILNVSISDGVDVSTNQTVNFTLDATAPIISNLINATTTNESVIITWNTDEEANESNILGICPSFTGVFINSNATLGTSHIQAIDSLSNSTNYCFNTTACDSSNNCAGVNFSFTTASNIETIQTNLVIASLQATYSNNTHHNFEFTILNNGTTNLTNINWSLDTGLDIIPSQQPLNLTAKENTTIFVDYTYDQTGTYSVTATATDGTNQDSETITINILDLEVLDLSVLNESGMRRTFEFVIKNYLSTSLDNVLWNISFGDNNNLNSSNIVLQPQENMSVYVDYTYSSANTYVVNATAINGTLSGYNNITITVT